VELAPPEKIVRWSGSGPAPRRSRLSRRDRVQAEIDQLELRPDDPFDALVRASIGPFPIAASSIISLFRWT